MPLVGSTSPNIGTSKKKEPRSSEWGGKMVSTKGRLRGSRLRPSGRNGRAFHKGDWE